MNYVIFPNDDSTAFLGSIIDSLKSFIDSNDITIITCEASKDGYINSFNEIKSINNYSKVLFIGHSTEDVLYGGMSTSFDREPLISLKDMKLFKDTELFFLSCFSNKLLEKSRTHRNYSSCIGFGLLPSEIKEVDAHKQMRNLQLTKDDIEDFKKLLVEIMNNVIPTFFSEKNNVDKVFNLMKLTINKKINDIILSNGNIKLAKILYHVVNESISD
ncbi:hypothetical protein GIJ48_12905 [Escherichia coli]|nr:hypothetical protein [Escherichia coli]